MNAKFTMRTAAGCSILVAVCQSAAVAGGIGGSSFGGSAAHNISSAPAQTFQSSTHVTNVKAMPSSYGAEDRELQRFFFDHPEHQAGNADGELQDGGNQHLPEFGRLGFPPVAGTVPPVMGPSKPKGRT